MCHDFGRKILVNVFFVIIFNTMTRDGIEKGKKCCFISSVFKHKNAHLKDIKDKYIKQRDM